MQKNIISLLISITSLPGLNLLSRIFYWLALRKVKEHFKKDDRIIDIIMTSNINGQEFVYGRSDYNLLILVDNESHPKTVLKDFKKLLKLTWYTNTLINKNFLPILTEKEFSNNMIRSYFIRNCDNEKLLLKSVVLENQYEILIGKQNIFAVSHSAMQTLDYFLFKDEDKIIQQKEVKNIYQATLSLHKCFPNQVNLNKSWKALAQSSIRYDFLFTILKSKFQRATWKNLMTSDFDKQFDSTPKVLPLTPEVSEYFADLVKEEFIDDIILTPSIIQNKRDRIQGKLYVDLIVNEHITKKKNFNQIQNIREGIESPKIPSCKIKVRILTHDMIKLLTENALFSFPLDSYYKKQNSCSVNKYSYEYTIKKNLVRHAAIHFLIVQFMRFRSLEQKSNLIGSKFIKSLNLMYRYYLLLSYLRGETLIFERRESKIRECLSPQFNKLRSYDVVTPEDWLSIKAQLLYLLKHIRNELLKYDQSLKNLKF